MAEAGAVRRGAAQIVEQHGMHTVGIYREPGVKSRYEGRLRGFFNKCPTHIISLDEDRVDIKDVASLLKLYATRGLLGGGAGAGRLGTRKPQVARQPAGVHKRHRDSYVSSG